jgi:hypothetical protein
MEKQRKKRKRIGKVGKERAKIIKEDRMREKRKWRYRKIDKKNGRDVEKCRQRRRKRQRQRDWQKDRDTESERQREKKKDKEVQKIINRRLE